MKNFENLTTTGKIIWAIIGTIELVLAWGLLLVVTSKK